MKKETSKPSTTRHVHGERNQRKEALEVLLEARDRLLRQMTEEILAHREGLLDGPHPDGFFGFELQEIEDRYSARLNALNSLLDNLEYRRPELEHTVQVVRTTVDTIERDLVEFLQGLDDWDLVGIDVVRLDGDKLLAVVALTAESYPEG